MTSHLLAAETTLGPITGIGPLGNTFTSFGSSFIMLETILSNLIGALTIVASLWFIYQILLSALSWISSNGDKQNIQTAQKRLTNSFLGLLVAVVAYSVTALIGRILGMPNIFQLSAVLTTLHP